MLIILPEVLQRNSTISRTRVARFGLILLRRRPIETLEILVQQLANAHSGPRTLYDPCHTKALVAH